MEQVPAATVPVQLVVPLLTVTLPVGVPAPGEFTVTLKLTVTLWPTTEGSGASEGIAVAVAGGVTRGRCPAVRGAGGGRRRRGGAPPGEGGGRGWSAPGWGPGCRRGPPRGPKKRPR